MGFLDVLSGRQSVGSWLTGRDPKEADVAANYDHVAVVSENIRNIGTTSVGNAQDAIYNALEELNSVNGLAEYVGTINIGNYDAVFTSITDTVNNIADQLDSKAEAIKIYENSSIFEKIGSTALMGVCKVGEGLLSVAEDLGDGIVSIVGWGAGVVGADQFQQDCANFVKNEWSHDAFNFYYNSDFAKKSAITEDSAIAGAFKIAGKTAGYLMAGGVMASQTGLTAASKAIADGQKVGKIAGTVLKAASSSTWGATMAGALGGLGSGTEGGLNAGLSYNEAMGAGLKTAAIQGGLAFAGGKLGEKMAKNSAIKEAKANVAKAQDAVDDLSDDFIEGSFSKTAESSAKTFEAYGQLDDATEALAKAQSSKLSNYQGYTDSFTKAGEKLGTSLRDNGYLGTAKIGVQKAGTAVSNAKTSMQQSIAETRQAIADNGLGATVKQGVVDTAKSGAAAVRNAAGAAKTAVVEAAKHPIQTVGKATTTVVKAAASPVGATAAGAAINETIQGEGRQIAANTPAIATAPAPDNTPSGATQTIHETDRGATPVSPTPSPTPTPTQTQSPAGSNSSGNSGGGGGGGGGTPSTVATTPVTTPVTTPTTPITTPTTPITTPTTPVTTPTTPVTRTTPITTPTTPVTRTTPITTPTTPVTKPSSIGGGSPTVHGGGGYGDAGYSGEGADGLASAAGTLEDLLDGTGASIDEIIKGSKYSRIPTSSKPILSSGSGSSSVIPIAAGLSAASAAGLGAKAYMDHKHAKEEEEEDEEYEDYGEEVLNVGTWTDDEDPDALKTEGEDGEFINIDKQGDDGYFTSSESPNPIMGYNELEEV